MASSDSSNPWLGRMVGDNQRYRLDKRLGGGGMGEVFIAMDTRVGQQVALKLLKDTFVTSSEMRKRFEREIAVCAALQSDHIVKITDCGFTDEGYPFYVMEYLRGQTLRQLIFQEKRLSVSRTQAIISQVCKGLQLAHQGVTLAKEGITPIKVIHRDLKPDNIFLITTNLGEWVKILDFGLAKVRNQSVEQTNLTTTFVGTFRYAAPEQLQNDKNLDERADIYSLGLLTYEMLCGVDPFGLTLKGSKVSETSWVIAHAHGKPLPLHSSLPQNGEYISPQLEAVVMKCLHKKPEERFANVEELDMALQIAVQSQAGKSKRGDIPNTVIVQPLKKRGSHDETVSRSIQPTEQVNNKTWQNQGSNDETIARGIQPNQQGNPGNQHLTNQIQFQNRNQQGNPENQSLSNQTQFQNRNQQGNPENQSLSNQTQFQNRNQQGNSENQHLINQTQFQNRNQQGYAGNQSLSNQTQFQNRNQQGYAGNQSLSNQTKFQNRNQQGNPENQSLSNQTKFQPRSSQNNLLEIPDTIIETASESKQNVKLHDDNNSNENNNIFHRHLWKIIGMIFIFGLSFYIGMNFQTQDENNSNNQENIK